MRASKLESSECVDLRLTAATTQIPTGERNGDPGSIPGGASAAALPDSAKRELALTCLFGAFVFLQFTVLGLANHAGEGYLTAGQRELVYYALQVFVILGYLLHSLFFRFCTRKRMRFAIACGVFGAFFVCVAAMLAIGRDSLGCVIASMAAALFLGGIGGAAHIRMSMATVTGAGVARCMGIGSAIAVVMQYLLQIQWGETPLLPVFMLLALALLFIPLLRGIPQFAAAGNGEVKPTPPRRIASPTASRPDARGARVAARARMQPYRARGRSPGRFGAHREEEPRNCRRPAHLPTAASNPYIARLRKGGRHDARRLGDARKRIATANGTHFTNKIDIK